MISRQTILITLALIVAIWAGYKAAEHDRLNSDGVREAARRDPNYRGHDLATRLEKTAKRMRRKLKTYAKEAKPMRDWK